MGGVALGGFMGVGKTTVGRAVAVRLGLPFVDLDDVLEARHGPIPAQLAQGGEAAFRVRESAAVADLCDGSDRVLATGGGAWVDPDNRAALRAAGYLLVVLHAPLAVLRARVGDGSGRPLWAGAATLLASRAAAYSDADLALDTGARPVEAIVDAIVSVWEER